MHPIIRPATLALTATVIAFAGCGGDTDGASGADRTDRPDAGIDDDASRDDAASAGDADTAVTIADMAFSPADIDIDAGDTVAWVWDDGPVPHDVSFDDGRPARGGAVARGSARSRGPERTTTSARSTRR